ncbi:uncharacterized protein HKW66_Vig0201110 [Vigna angularis]|uniref:Uncharacterized protein n=1 Tax=Phaseolus angularis TaxID=3914 RepID=A0A8T0JV37_PHAAN|nr:uncharacterized protein LOC108347167 isoform X1 [Vigna angularis]KAG2380739.1 uncharacterized protein HKW66_Vig0201110 [Vigna angularis]
MTRSTISPSPIFISFTLLFITFACATSSLNEIENFKPKGSDGFTVPSHVEEQGGESVKEYLDSVLKNALFGSDSTETVQNKEAYPHSYAIEAESNTQIKDQVDAEPRLIIPKHIEDEGPEAIKKYLDDLFSKALFGTDSTQTGQNQEPHQHSNSIQLDSKTHIKQDGKKMEEEDKSFNKVCKLRKEEELVNDDIAVNVSLEIVGDGEYVLKIKRVNRSSNNEDEVERAKHLAQNGAMLLHYGEILQDMGEKLITQSQALLYSVFNMSAPPKFNSHDQ